MNVSLAFGKNALELAVPDRKLQRILTPNEVSGGIVGEAEVLRALAAPIGTKRLSRLVHPGQKVAIVTSDVTRPLPTHRILPLVVAELGRAGIPDEDITVVFALGSHRPHTDAERARLVGADLFGRLRCVDSTGPFTHLGTTERSTPVDIFTPVAEADFRICLGNIEFHYFAGYSGGAKAIMPGVSTREAIQCNHSFMTREEAKAGRLEGNPIREDIEETVARFVPVDFLVNVVLDEHKEIRCCVAGHPVLAHREGCAYLDRLYKVEIAQKADIVIVSPGGYPKDLNLYQAQKALDNAKHAVKDGGTILWVASCQEGLGEGVFERWMTGHERPGDMIEHIRREFELGGHKAAAIAMVLEKADIYLYSDLDEAFVRSIHLRPCRDAQKVLDAALERYGDGAAVLVMPFGGSTLPVVG